MKIKYLSWKQKHLKHEESSWKHLQSTVSVQVIEGVGQNSIGEEERKNNLGTFFSLYHVFSLRPQKWLSLEVEEKIPPVVCPASLAQPSTSTWLQLTRTKKKSTKVIVFSDLYAKRHFVLFHKKSNVPKILQRLLRRMLSQTQGQGPPPDQFLKIINSG